MEDTLREDKQSHLYGLTNRLNPCFNGRYSQSDKAAIARFGIISLNPCFNGRYSQSICKDAEVKNFDVLILVLMEDTLRESIQDARQVGRQRLNPCFNGRYSQSCWSCCSCCIYHSLNPCFNGRYSQSLLDYLLCFLRFVVLILVLMEDTLREKKA